MLLKNKSAIATMRKLDSHMHVNGTGANWGWKYNDLIIDAADRLGIEKLCVSIPVTRDMPTMEQVRACNDAVLDAMLGLKS